MKKSVRYRSDAKILLGVGLLLGAIGCAIYGILLIPEVKGVSFEWEYLAIAGGTTLAFVMISLFFFWIGGIHARRERVEEELQERYPELALEPEDQPIVIAQRDTSVTINVPASVDCTEDDPLNAQCVLALDGKTVKKVAKIAVPAIAACTIAVLWSKNAKNAKSAKKRRDFYRWLG